MDLVIQFFSWLHISEESLMVQLFVSVSGTPWYGGRAFAVAGPTVWNSLPDFIRDPLISTDSFRCLVKTYLFSRY